MRRLPKEYRGLSIFASCPSDLDGYREEPLDLSTFNLMYTRGDFVIQQEVNEITFKGQRWWHRTIVFSNGKSVGSYERFVPMPPQDTDSIPF